MAGYGEGSKAPIIKDGLFKSSQDLKTIGVTIDSSAIDAANPDGTSTLRKGLVLCKVTASGAYKQYDDNAVDGTESEATAVILTHEVVMDGTKDNVATVLFEGTINADHLVWKDAGAEAAFNFANVTGSRLLVGE